MQPAHARNRTRSFMRPTLVFALLGALALYTLFYLSAPGQIAFAAGNVTGTVFRDYNADNSRGTRDTGIGGVTVKAFNAAGAVVATATTVPQCVGNNLPAGSGCTGVNAPLAGTYSLGSLPSGQYRIEFTTTNTALKPGAGYAGNGTTVQFIDVTAGAVTNLNVGFNNPHEYCQSNPDLVTPCYLAGAQSGTAAVLYSQDYTENSPESSPASQTTEARAQDIGTTWGLAYRSTTGILYAGAYLKRGAGFDVTPALIDRPGQVYSVNISAAANGTPYVVIPNAGGTAGSDLHSDFNPSNADNDFDSVAFPLVGKKSLGDIELSQDESTLYVVNLNNRSLYSVNLSTNAVSLISVVPKPSDIGCNAHGEGRPFGLGLKDKVLYVGGVCTAESTTSGNIGVAADLRAYVYAFDTTTNTFGASPVINFSLNFDRQCLNIGTGGTGGLPLCKTGINRPNGDWNPWRDTYSALVRITGSGSTDTYSLASGNGGYPMPMLSDIVFDGDDMILGFRDRSGDMLGTNDPGPTQSQHNPTLNTTGSGDILRANPNGSDGWTIENDSNSNPAGIFGPTAAGAASPQGPGGGEFYVGDNHNNHDETVFGGLAQVPGNSEVAMTVLDPDQDGSNTLAGGTTQFSNVDDHPSIAGVDNEGQRVRSVELYDYNIDTTRFSKSNGLGDLEALCNAAPLEIGNRVWRDSDGDGIQDPGEMPLSGITVQLVRSGTVVGTAVTNLYGEYYFVSSTVADSNTSDNIGQVSETVSGQQGIARATSYVVRINPTLSTAQANLLNGLTLSPANAADAGAGDGGANADARDSDATVNSSNYEIAFTTGGAGDNNHTFDIGFSPLGSIGNRVWVDEDSNGYQDEGEDGLANITVALRNSGGTVIATTITDSQGYYLFTGLVAGTYSVKVQSGIPSGMTQTTIYPNAGADLYNQNQSPANGYSVTIGAGQDNLTADFGYNRNPTNDVNTGGATNTTAALGDRVWIDTNGNGRQDAGEVGVSGVTVTLTGPGPDGLFSTTGDNTTATTTTDSNGYYIFDGLTPGAFTVTVTSASGASHAILTSGQYNQTGDPDHWGTTGTNNDTTTTTPVVLGPGDVFLDADFGYQPNSASLGSVGNFVWFDRDADGVGPTVNGEAHGGAPGTDNTEEGIGGVSVALIRDLNDNGVWNTGEPIIATMYTSDGTQDVDGDGTVDPKGFYRFRGLQITTGTGTNDYLVWVNDTARQLDGLRATYDLDGSGTPASGLVTGFGMSVVHNLTGNVVNHDFGYTPDNSGEQASRTTLSTTESGSIGNYVWFDIDGDGNGPGVNGDGTTLPETGEVGIAGVRVFLYQDSNQSGTLDAGEPLIAVTYTSPEGYYLFTNLVTTNGPGTDDYIVRVDTTTLPGGLGQTYDATSPTSDSTSAVADLTSTPVLTQDFGYRGANVSGNLFGSIGNLVWNDVNADGNVDAGENGIAGVTVDLYFDTNGNGVLDAGEPLLETQTTSNGSQDVDNDGSNDALGFYRFRNLPTNDGAGNNAQYIVDVSDRAGVLSGYFHSLGNQSQTADNESKTDPYAVTLAPTNASTRDITTVDFGYYVLPAALGNFVWNDTNGNGVQEAGEVGINGVVVQLTITYPGANGVVGTGGDDTVTILRTTTGTNPNQTGTQLGWYSFDNLLQDEDYNGVNTVGTGEPTFVISIVTADNTGVLANLVKTNVDQGSDLLDSDNHAGVTATTTEGQRNVAQQTLGSSESTIASYDFGYTAPVNLGNRVWYDTDNDGLYEPNGNDGNAGTTADNEVGINNVTVRIYRDTNGNGTFDPATDTLIGTTTTDGTGSYNFTFLTPSLSAVNSTKYLVVLPDTNFMSGGALVGYQNSTLTDAANSDVDNRDHGQVSGTLGNANGVVTTNGAVVLTVGGEPAVGVDTDGTNGNLTIDFGFYKLSLTGTVFNDANNNGSLDAGENTAPIVNNVTVKLYRDTNSNGVYDAGDTLLATTTTNATGDYSFTNLSGGKYIVNVVVPNNYHSTIDTANQTDTETPNTGADNNDNGYGTSYNNTYSHAFDLNPNDKTTNPGNTVTFSNGTTANDRQDFGLSQSPTAAELGTLTAAANDDASVTVTWETLSESTALGFNVQRSATRSDGFANVNAEVIPALSLGSNTGNAYTFTDTTSEGGATYYYRIQLLRADATTFEGESVRVKVKAAANACSGKTEAPLLNGPEKDAKLKAGKIDFTWNAVACAASYNIELHADSKDGALVTEKTVKDTTFSFKKLEQGTTYYWRVSACNAKGKCVAGEWWSFKIKQDKDKK